MIANKYLIKQVEKIFAWNAEFAPPIVQVAAEVAIRNSEEWKESQVSRTERNMGILYSGLEKIDGFKVHKPTEAPRSFLTLATSRRIP
jgi:aspartate/methionine/tyrosine aminotransferase